MPLFQVGQKVKIMNKQSPYYGRCGVIERSLFDSESRFSYLVKFDWVDDLVPVGTFPEKHLKKVPPESE